MHSLSALNNRATQLGEKLFAKTGLTAPSITDAHGDVMQLGASG